MQSIDDTPPIAPVRRRRKIRRTRVPVNITKIIEKMHIMFDSIKKLPPQTIDHNEKLYNIAKSKGYYQNHPIKKYRTYNH